MNKFLILAGIGLAGLMTCAVLFWIVSALALHRPVQQQQAEDRPIAALTRPDQNAPHPKVAKTFALFGLKGGDSQSAVESALNEQGYSSPVCKVDSEDQTNKCDSTRGNYRLSLTFYQSQLELFDFSFPNAEWNEQARQFEEILGPPTDTNNRTNDQGGMTWTSEQTSSCDTGIAKCAVEILILSRAKDGAGIATYVYGLLAREHVAAKIRMAYAATSRGIIQQRRPGDTAYSADWQGHRPPPHEVLPEYQRGKGNNRLFVWWSPGAAASDWRAVADTLRQGRDSLVTLGFAELQFVSGSSYCYAPVDLTNGIGELQCGPTNAVPPSSSASQQSSSQIPFGATAVIRYTPPTNLPDTDRKGSCWTGSIAASYRPDAWRCMDGNGISDPCFSLPDQKAVVCDANPSEGKAGVKLDLTEPLPKPRVPPARSGQPWPWLVELNDGTTCNQFTGTMPQIDGQSAHYGCIYKPNDQQSLLVGDLDTSTPLWTAQRATLVWSGSGWSLKSRKSAPVKAVWQ